MIEIVDAKMGGGHAVFYVCSHFEDGACRCDPVAEPHHDYTFAIPAGLEGTELESWLLASAERSLIQQSTHRCNCDQRAIKALIGLASRQAANA